MAQIRGTSSLRRVKYITSKTTSYQLTVRDAMVFAAVTVAGAYTINLPLVNEAAGLIISIRYARGEAQNITIAQNGSDGGTIVNSGVTNAASIVLTTFNKYTVLYSNGEQWYELAGSH